MIVALDPGGTTGWALVDARIGTSPRQLPVVLQSGQVGGWDGLAAILPLAESASGGDAAQNPPIVVIESFALFEHESKSLVGDHFIASQVIGVAKYLAASRGVSIVMQAPAQKVFWHDRRLREYGYLPAEYAIAMHENRHAIDAIRHALHYCHFTLGLRVKPFSDTSS